MTTYYLEPTDDYAMQAIRNNMDLSPDDLDGVLHKDIKCADDKKRNLVEVPENKARFLMNSMRTDRNLKLNSFADLNDGNGIVPYYFEPTVPSQPAAVAKKTESQAAAEAQSGQSPTGGEVKVTVSVRFPDKVVT